MEVDGKEFLRNVGIEQDKERLIQEQKRLEELKRASVKREQNYVENNVPKQEDESAFVDLSINDDATPHNPNSVDNIDDMRLDTSKTNNKKKYIMLGFGLILLFIITVLVIRLISNNETESQLDSPNVKQEVTKDDILNKIDTNEQYQDVIDKKNQLNEQSSALTKQKEPMSGLQVPEQSANNVPLVIDTPKVEVQPKRDLFGLDKESQQVAKKETPNVSKKVVQPKIGKKVAPIVREKRVIPQTTNASGYFIQIGAFTKEPNRSLLRNITSKGYQYKINQVTIKGRLYNKVLVGPFDSRSDAASKLGTVKKDFSNPNAYILKI